ncbi:sodium-dependent transporter [Elongatibacter sediminis]|uniref:Sodium-dependent transporter n=1 Tax=Elongatibacter sediminis TaxID=3119006 RepID=A0AAW9R954_9GAMM
MDQSGQHETWSSRSAFLLAAIGAAVGLGNIWRFPYLAGESGGSAFVMVYLLCVAGVGIPILIAELMMGRRGGLSPVGTMAALAREAGASRHWRTAGWLMVLTIFLAGTFYYVVASWVLAYIGLAARGMFAGIDGSGSQSLFAELLADPWRLSLWFGVFMALTIFVAASGIRAGLERAVRLLMPSLFVLLVVMVIYAAVAGDFARGWRFLFHFDASKLSASVVLAAIGQAFFTLGVGQAVMITYAAYMPKNVRLSSSAFIIAGADLLVALLAALAIFPIVFAAGLEPNSGPGLIFETLPVAFGQMPGGRIIATVFFVLVGIAALTSTISGVEPIVSWAEEHRGWSRRRVSVAVGLAIWLVGLGSVFSFNIWAGYKPLGMLPVLSEKTVFDLLEYVTVNVLMPLNGLLIAVFAGWVMSRVLVSDELGIADGRRLALLRFLLRFVVPLAILAIFVSQ